MAVPFFKHTGIFTEMEIGALLASVNFSSLIHLSASLKFIIGALDTVSTHYVYLPMCCFSCVCFLRILS